MLIELTDISLDSLQKVSSGAVTAHEALEYLTKELTLRSFADELKKLYKNDDLWARLVKAFAEYDTGGDTQKSARKVSAWLSGKSAPVSRDDYFKICFALGFDEKQADSLLIMSSENRIHYRNPTELIYAFCLAKGKSYSDALRLKEAAGSFMSSKNPDRSFSTELVRNDFRKLSDEKELLDYLNAKRDCFGMLHNTAYKKFCSMFELLKNPDGSSDFTTHGDSTYSIEETVNNYLKFRVSGKLKPGAAEPIAKMFKKYWPSPSSVKKINAGFEDVSRKALLLLYVALEGVFNEEYDELDEDYLTPEERFEEHYWRINLMLDECGMCQLDPRNPFDWVLLFTVNASGDEFMSDRMNEITSLLYEEELQ